MKKRLISSLLAVLILFSLTSSALALPEPRNAHYPRGGKLTLSPVKETNNTYAFKATGKSHSKAVLQINGAYADIGGTVVSIQMFVVNKWGNWIAFGAPETLVLDYEPSSHEFQFPIRARKQFCIQVSAYGISGYCEIPYQIITM